MTDSKLPSMCYPALRLSFKLQIVTFAFFAAHQRVRCQMAKERRKLGSAVLIKYESGFW